jgi:outer membrane protein assembly factor BamD (BamD/ComL family)
MSHPPLAVDVSPGLRVLRRSRRCLTWGLLALALGAALTLAGCRSAFDVSALKPGGGLDQRESIAGIMGPTERNLKRAAWQRKKTEMTAGRNPEDQAAIAELEAAQKLYDAGRYRDAEKAFKSLAEARRVGGLSWAERFTKAFQMAGGGVDKMMYDQYGDPIEEDALFMVAESQFAQKKYSWAQDSYDRLLKKYPSTRHMDEVTGRLFAIAHTWMGFPRPDEKGDVQLASGELLKTNPRTGNKDLKKPSFVNVTNRSRPVFDTAGRALQALESIWLHDANGPLADDALMLTANYHLQTGDFVEAARVYELLREQYPDSPHFKDAFVLESHVRLAAYEGPAYDAKGLEASKERKQTARELFPDLTEQQKAMLDKELQNIEIAEVRREWHKVQFYRSKGNDAAVAAQCNKILNRYPDSRYAKLAQRELEAIARRHRNASSWNPFSGISGDADSPVLQGIIRPPARTAQTQPPPQDQSGQVRMGTGGAAAGKSDKPQEPSLFRRFLRRADSDPQLRPVEREPTSDDGSSGRATLN